MERKSKRKEWQSSATVYTRNKKRRQLTYCKLAAFFGEFNRTNGRSILIYQLHTYFNNSFTMFANNFPAIGSVVAFSVQSVETRDFPLLSAICSNQSTHRLDTCYTFFRFTAVDVCVNLHLGSKFLHIFVADSFQGGSAG